jgi:hypothetical protein
MLTFLLGFLDFTLLCLADEDILERVVIRLRDCFRDPIWQDKVGIKIMGAVYIDIRRGAIS